MGNTISLEEYDYKIYNNALSNAKELILKGGVIIIPSDTVYCFCCSPKNKKAIEKIAKIKGVNLRHSKFSLMFSDL